MNIRVYFLYGHALDEPFFLIKCDRHVLLADYFPPSSIVGFYQSFTLNDILFTPILGTLRKALDRKGNIFYHPAQNIFDNFLVLTCT
jgi:hypothetical protein